MAWYQPAPRRSEPDGLWRPRTSVVGGAGVPSCSGALLHRQGGAGQHGHVAGGRAVEAAEDEAVGAVRADPAALDAGLVRRREVAVRRRPGAAQEQAGDHGRVGGGGVDDLDDRRRPGR